MELVGGLLTLAGLIVLLVAFVVDEEAFVFLGVIFTLLGGVILLTIAPSHNNHDSITMQEIEYAINKCSSFGGLKEFRSDVIICMDKTEINMNFEPEKKVEAE